MNLTTLTWKSFEFQKLEYSELLTIGESLIYNIKFINYLW